MPSPPSTRSRAGRADQRAPLSAPGARSRRNPTGVPSHAPGVEVMAT
jgi:hypothetical protein